LSSTCGTRPLSGSSSLLNCSHQSALSTQLAVLSTRFSRVFPSPAWRHAARPQWDGGASDRPQ
ncbi:hypothetical protein BaRGS_00028282, partial [Batillaria attramentaria]